MNLLCGEEIAWQCRWPAGQSYIRLDIHSIASYEISNSFGCQHCECDQRQMQNNAPL